MKKLLLCLAFLGSFSTPLFAQEDAAAAEKAAIAAQKAAEKAALAEQKAAEKAIKDAEKAALKAQKDAEKLALAEEKAKEKAAQQAQKEAEKLALAEQKAKEKAQKDAEKLALAEEKAREKAIRDAETPEEKAERQATEKLARAEQKAKEKAEKDAQKEADALAIAEEKAKEKAIRDAETPEERANRKKAEKLAKKAEKKAIKEAPYLMDVHYQPHSTGITYRMGQVGDVGSQTFSFDIYTRQRKGKSQYTPMVSLRFNAPFSSNYVGDLGGHGTWGFLFGGSQYVFDIRSKETGLGWSMLVNGGMTFEFSTVAAVNTFSDILRHTLILGAEMDFKAIYNFNKYVGATVGLTFGYAAAPDFESLINENADPSGVDHGLIWGLSMGLIF